MDMKTDRHPIRFDDKGNVWADGCRYEDNKKSLLKAAKTWRDCARSVVKSAQEDTDEIYRLMGAGAAWHRLNVSRALLARAMSKGR